MKKGWWFVKEIIAAKIREVWTNVGRKWICKREWKRKITMRIGCGWDWNEIAIKREKIEEDNYSDAKDNDSSVKKWMMK